MIKIFLLLYFLSLYLSLPGFFTKAGYNTLSGLIPFYNIYIFIQILEISPFLLIVLSLLLIFLPDRVYIATLIFVFLPFMICDAYDKGKITGLLGCIVPFIIYPLVAYFTGTYRYDMED